MRRRKRKRAGRGPLPAEQVASAQSHEVDLAGASGPNGGEEHLKRRHRQRFYYLVQSLSQCPFTRFQVQFESEHQNGNTSFLLLKFRNHREGNKFHL